MKPKLIIFLLLSLGIIGAHSQTKFELMQSAGYMSNSYYSSNEMADFSTRSTLDFRQGLKWGQLVTDMYYGAEWTQFQNETDRQNLQHALGLVSSLSLESGRTNLFLGSELTLGDYRNTYDWLDNNELSLFFTAKRYFRKNQIYRVGYQLLRQDYPDLPEFNHTEHQFYSQLNMFFQTGTSLLGYVRYGLKNYAPISAELAADYPDLPTQMPGVDQLLLSARVAQSLGAATAMQLQYRHRLNPGIATGTALVMDDTAIFTEDELFTDPYGYTGPELSWQGTHYSSPKMKWELGFKALERQYTNRRVYNLEGSLNEAGKFRRDRRYILWGRVSRSFPQQWNLNSLRIIVDSGYLMNSSNDDYYNYDNFFSSLSLHISL